MANTVVNKTIKVADVIYTMTRPGYYYENRGGKQKRISGDEWQAAYEIWNREMANKLDDLAAEKSFKKKSLTPKQKRFIELLPTDEQFKNLDSQIYTDVYCDTISAEFSPMSAGAIVTTLKEKGVIDVGTNRINGRKCKFFSFTDEGKKIVKDILDK